MTKFPFFYNIVAETQTDHPNWTHESCEEFSIVSVFAAWKPNMDEHAVSNISLYLYMMRLFKTFPHLAKLAEKSTMWSIKAIKENLSYIAKTKIRICINSHKDLME